MEFSYWSLACLALYLLGARAHYTTTAWAIAQREDRIASRRECLFAASIWPVDVLFSEVF